LGQYSFAKKLQSQNVSREKLCKVLLYKKGAYNVGEIHQCFKRSFYTLRSQMCKNDSQIVNLFTLSGSTSVKAELKTFGEFDTRAQFHQRSMYSFYARRSQKHKKILLT